MDERTNPTDCRQAIYSEDYNDYIFEYLESKESLNGANNICTQFVDRGVSIIYLPAAGDPMVNKNQFRYQTVPKLYGLMDTSAAEAVGVLRVRRQPYLDLYGQGTLIGIVDTGVDYTNPVFLNADGSTRIYSIWDQTIRDGEPPEGLLYGAWYKQEEINEALQAENPYEVVPEQDEIGHGTFLLGLAAGGEMEEEDFTGIAPQAELVVVKLKEAKNNLKQYYCVRPDVNAYSGADLILGVKYLLMEARRRRSPITILIGLGTNAGNHCGCIPFPRYLGRQRENGVAIITSAGNEGNRGHHYEKERLEIGESDEAELKVDENEFGFSMEIWVDSPGLASVELITPLGETTERIPLIARGNEPIRFPLERTLIYVEYTLIEPNAGKQLIFVRLLNPTPGIWRIRVRNEDNFATKINIWLPIDAFIKQGTIFLDPEPDTTICEPGNAPLVMTITAYDHYSGSIFLNASRGYNSNGFIKPELSAPGVNVYGPYPKNRFGRMTGTSAAAALTAGCACLMMEWGIIDENDPFMQTTRITNYFTRGARRKDIVYPNREWGYGELDLYRVFEQMRFTN